MVLRVLTSIFGNSFPLPARASLDQLYGNW
jgi:hypothetical protein